MGFKQFLFIGFLPGGSVRIVEDLMDFSLFFRIAELL
jgi:hypothetical protein